MIIPAEKSRKLAELARTVHLWRTTVFDWDEGNCLTSPWDHVNRVHPGADCGSTWRGRIGGEAGANAILEANGGPVKVFGAELARFGFEETSSPEAGDVVIAEFPGGYIGGVKTASGACFRAVHGATEVRDGLLPPLSGWRL